METRQEFNFKIANLLKEMPVGQLPLTVTQNFAEIFEALAYIFPQQRASQIICNYICDDYRSKKPKEYTKLIMETLFPNNPDPFFEESSETYKRLNKMNDMFICSCNNTEHHLVFNYDKELNAVYCDVHLIPEHNIFKRMWIAIKYIFGHRSKYGHFDEFIFNPEDADRLQKIVNHLKSIKE